MANDSGITEAEMCANLDAYVLGKKALALTQEHASGLFFTNLKRLDLSKAIADLLSEIARLSAEVESLSWIRCEDRLPEEMYKCYLVQSTVWGIQIDRYDTAGFANDVIAWMPLPEPMSFEEAKANEK